MFSGVTESLSAVFFQYNPCCFYSEPVPVQNVSSELNMYINVSAYKYMFVLVYLCVYSMYWHEYMFQCTLGYIDFNNLVMQTL
jgi:hypothetical protein